MAAILKTSLKNVQGSLKPVLYYGKVGVELTKQVWTKEKLGPPALAEWPAAQKQLVQAFGNLKSSYILNLTVKEALTKGLVGFQIFSFFIVGEIIGRGSIIGYKIATPAAAEHH